MPRIALINFDELDQGPIKVTRPLRELYHGGLGAEKLTQYLGVGSQPVPYNNTYNWRSQTVALPKPVAVLSFLAPVRVPSVLAAAQDDGAAQPGPLVIVREGVYVPPAAKLLEQGTPPSGRADCWV